MQRAFAADEISGTRLRARYWLVEGDGGQRVPQISGLDAVWFDTKLGTPCVWRPAGASSPDASYVCFPYSAYGVQPNVFTDAQCTMPARLATSYFFRWVANEGGPGVSPMSNTTPFNPPWGSNELDRQTSCADKGYAADGDGIVELGAPVTTPFYSGLNGCTPVTPQPGEIVRSVGRKVASSELATARVVRDDTGHRLSALQLVSDDGARQRIGWYDNVLGAACKVGVAADGKRRCLLEVVQAPDAFYFFADASGGPLAFVSADTNPYKPGDYVRTVGEPLACGQTRTTLFRIGAAYDGDIYTPGSSTPLPADVKPAGIYLHVTEVPAESMDLFEPKTLGGRLQHTVFVDAEGAMDAFPFGASAFGGAIARFTEELIDSTLQQPCRFQHLADGSIRCVPAWSEQAAGLNCTRNVVVNLQPFTKCLGDPVPKFTAVWKGDACAGGYAFSALGQVIAPGGGAVGQCLVGGSDGTLFYEIGAASPPTTFAAATLMTE